VAATVAVIIPTYNRAELVTQAIDSVLNQTRMPDEIIVVDDGSTDDTWQRLQEYGSPVIPVRHENNRGRSAARNTGILRSTAELLCFLDSDDLLTPHSIEVRADRLEANPEVGIVYGQTNSVDMRTSTASEHEQFHISADADLFRNLVKFNNVPNLALMLRRESLPETPYFDPNLDTLEDWDFILRVAAQHPVLDVISEVIGLYRRHDNMTMLPGKRYMDSTMRVQNRIYSMGAFKTMPPVHQARTCCSHAINRMDGGFAGKARESLRRSIRTAPWYVPAYGLLLSSWIAPSIPRTLIRLLNRLRGGAPD